eukprot:402427-Pelagomonas_calceolata.AAC.2
MTSHAISWPPSKTRPSGDIRRMRPARTCCCVHVHGWDKRRKGHQAAAVCMQVRVLLAMTAACL